MLRVAEVVLCAELPVDVLVQPSDELEVSLDCDHCRRTDRTVVFRVGEATARCCPGSAGRRGQVHPPYPGRIATRTVRRSSCGDVLIVTYSLEYRVGRFVDAKYGEESRPWTGLPTWGRVGYTVTCPSCGASGRQSTQTNLVRPIAHACSCGHVLHLERSEMPLLRWLDPRSATWCEAPERFGARE